MSYNHNTKKYQPVLPGTDLQMRAARLAAEQEEVQRQLDLIHHFGAEPEDGSVIYFEKALAAGGKAYRCVALREGPYWYRSGMTLGRYLVTWGELVNWLVHGVPCMDIQVCTEWTPLEDVAR